MVRWTCAESPIDCMFFVCDLYNIIYKTILAGAELFNVGWQVSIISTNCRRFIACTLFREGVRAVFDVVKNKRKTVSYCCKTHNPKKTQPSKPPAVTRQTFARQIFPRRSHNDTPNVTRANRDAFAPFVGGWDAAPRNTSITPHKMTVAQTVSSLQHTLSSVSFNMSRESDVWFSESAFVCVCVTNNNRHELSCQETWLDCAVIVAIGFVRV